MIKGAASALWGIARLGDPYNCVLKRNDLDGLGNVQYIRTYSGKPLADAGVITLTHDVQGNLVQVAHSARPP